MSKKNIAIFLDGTWNQVDDYTNVYTLYQYCHGIEVDVNGDKQQWNERGNLVNEASSDQVRYYDSGVGTSALSSPVLIGGAIGLGLKKNVAQAYLSLCREYKPGDHIFIFGFSRGAYTARSLAGLLNNFGVLKADFIQRSPVGITPISKAMAHRKDLKIPKLAVSTYRAAGLQRHAERKNTMIKNFANKYCLQEEVPIRFMGIFDTVGALGIPSFLDPLGNRSSKPKNAKKSFLARNHMPNAEFPKNVGFACHALAVDEFRPHFKPTLWVEPKNAPNEEDQTTLWAEAESRNVEQRWFVGAHSNVGGGYPDNLLNNKPLFWIYQHAMSHGLRMSDFLVPHQTVHIDEPINDSFASFRALYKLINYSEYYRYVNPGDHSQSLDRSVLERIEQDPVYRTRNLMELSADDIKALLNNATEFDDKLNQRIKHLSSKAGDGTS